MGRFRDAEEMRRCYLRRVEEIVGYSGQADADGFRVQACVGKGGLA